MNFVFLPVIAKGVIPIQIHRAWYHQGVLIAVLVHGNKFYRTVGTVDRKGILAVTDGGVHGDHKAGAVCVNGGDHLDAGLDIIAQLDFIPLHAGLNIYMDGTGSVLSDVNKLILRHILGGPAGQLDNKANRG